MSCSTLGNPGMISRPSFSHVVAPLPHSYSHAEHHEKYCVWLVLHPSYAISDTETPFLFPCLSFFAYDLCL